MTSYQPSIPTGSVPLNQDYLNIQGNFSQLDTTFGIDHAKFSQAANNGFHSVVHLIPVSTLALPVGPPTPVALTGEVYCNQLTDSQGADECLFFQGGGGHVTQLTTTLQPSVVANGGYTTLNGGMIMQWGNFDPNSSLTVTFPKTFGTVFNLQLTGSASNNSTFRVGVSTGTLTTTGFTWQGTVDSHWKPIYWIAIGK